MNTDPDFHSILSAPQEDKPKPRTRFPKLTIFSSTGLDGFKRSKVNAGEKSFKEGLLLVGIICIMASFSYRIIFKHFGGMSLSGKPTTTTSTDAISNTIDT